MKTLSSAQTKIIFIGAGLVFMYGVCFWIFYLPARNQMNELQSNFNYAHREIQKVKNVVEGGASAGSNILALEEQYRILNSRFPRREEESLQVLSDLARQFKIEVLSIRPQPKKEFIDQSKKVVSIENKNIQNIRVLMDLRCSYKSLVHYLEGLGKSMPGHLTVEKLIIKKQNTQTLQLNVSLELNLYLAV